MEIKNVEDKELKEIKNNILNYLEENWEINHNPNALQMLHEFGLYESGEKLDLLLKLKELYDEYRLDYIIERGCLIFVEHYPSRPRENHPDALIFDFLDYIPIKEKLFKFKYKLTEKGMNLD